MTATSADSHDVRVGPTMHGMTVVEDQHKGVVNTGFSHSEDRLRKVSINSDAIQADEERQRKISSGSHSISHGRHLQNGDKHHFVDPGYVQSEFLHSQLQERLQNHAARPDASWWFLLCTKCRQKETGPGWEPSYWQSVCPYPFCPTYRHIARCVALVLLVLLAWGVVYAVIGPPAAPGGQLYDMAMLVIFAHLGGYVFRMMNIPGLVGMLAVGIVYQNTGFINIEGEYKHVSAVLRRMALVIILTRAGMDMDPAAMRRLFWTTLKLGLVPWCVEAAVIIIASHYLLGLPWMWAMLTAAIVAAVSPAVIVPCLFRLRNKGYGVAKGIPTVVVAVSGIDDAASVAAFGIIQSLMFSEHSFLYNLALGPVSFALGVGFGVAWGVLSRYIPEKGDPFVVPLRILMLLGGGLLAVFGSEGVGMDGAGPLGVVAASFFSSWVWSTQGWEFEDNPVQTAFEIFWMVFEPILFSLTGTQIRLGDIDPHMFTIVVGCIVLAAILRQLSTVLVAIGGSLNLKEKIFVAIAWMSKASVQAALAPVTLETVRKLGMTEGPEQRYAELVLMMCVSCIIITAPLGAILITLTGPRLLTKTMPGFPEGWRRSARPSMRDITVIDEGNEADDIERRSSHHSSLYINQLSPHTPPNMVVTQQP